MFLNAKSFFEGYVQNYFSAEDPYLFQKKYNHTYEVVEYTQKIFQHLSFESHEQKLALTIALFHDLGRFVQAKKFQRFRDSADTFDHAKESVAILKEHNWFSQNHISQEDEDIICYAIYYHNKLDLPKEENEKTKFAKLIRDADKLANLRSISCRDDLNNPLLEKTILPKNLEDYFHNRCIEKKNQISALDHVLLHICFLYDFNYDESIRLCFEEELLKPYFEILKEYLNSDLYQKIYAHYVQYKEALLDDLM